MTRQGCRSVPDTFHGTRQGHCVIDQHALRREIHRSALHAARSRGICASHCAGFSCLQFCKTWVCHALALSWAWSLALGQQRLGCTPETQELGPGPNGLMGCQQQPGATQGNIVACSECQHDLNLFWLPDPGCWPLAPGQHGGPLAMLLGEGGCRLSLGVPAHPRVMGESPFRHSRAVARPRLAIPASRAAGSISPLTWIVIKLAA